MPFSRGTVEKLLADGGFFWLDLDQPGEDDFEILREAFGLHSLAVEDPSADDTASLFLWPVGLLLRGHSSRPLAMAVDLSLECEEADAPAPTRRSV